MREHSYWVYILASGPCGWLYVGMTNDLIRRVGEHKHGQIDGYSRERGTDQLVWYERHQYVDQAILREKRIKRWLRPWKFALVEETNPRWLDLYGALIVASADARISPEAGCPGECVGGGVTSRLSASLRLG